MKLLLATIFITGLTQAFAAQVVVPMSRVNLFVGTFTDLEKGLKDRILKKAEETCGSLENAQIGKTDITFSVTNVYTHNVATDKLDSIEGAYPTVGAKLNISCYDNVNE